MNESSAFMLSVGGRRLRPRKKNSSFDAVIRWSNTPKYTRAASPSCPRISSSPCVDDTVSTNLPSRSAACSSSPTPAPPGLSRIARCTTVRQFATFPVTTAPAPAAAPPVLLPAQQHVPRDRSLHPRQKTAMLGQKRQRHAALPAQPHQERATRNIPEANDAAQRVDRHPQFRLLLDPHRHRLAIARQVGFLRGHVQRVQQLFHRGTSSSRNSRARYRFTTPRFDAVRGRHRSYSEHRSHFFAYTAGGVTRAAYNSCIRRARPAVLVRNRTSNGTEIRRG